MKKGIVEVQIAKKIVKRKKNYNATSDALPGPELKTKRRKNKIIIQNQNSDYQKVFTNKFKCKDSER